MFISLIETQMLLYSSCAILAPIGDYRLKPDKESLVLLLPDIFYEFQHKFHGLQKIDQLSPKTDQRV